MAPYQDVKDAELSQKDPRLWTVERQASQGSKGLDASTLAVVGRWASNCRL